MRRWFAAALAILTTVGIPAPAQAARPAFEVAITSLDPHLMVRGSTTTVAVTLTNPSEMSFSGLSARLTISLAPLAGRSRIAEVSAGDYAPTYRNAEGAPVTDIDLASGASTVVTLRASADELGLRNAVAGVYVLGVSVTGTAESGRRYTTQARTLLSWMPTTRVANPLYVAPIWLVSAPPSRGVDGVFLNDSLARAVMPGGRLRAQLDVMRNVLHTTWVVDPLVLEGVYAISTGARITGNGEVRAASREEMAAAETWLADFRSGSANAEVAALPLASLDVRATLAADKRPLVRRAVTAAAARVEQFLDLTDVPTVVPINGTLTSTAWRLLAELGVDGVLLPDSTYQATTTQFTQSTLLSVPAFSDRPVLVSDTQAGNALIATRSVNVSADQRFTAELLMTLLERPNSRRVIAVVPPLRWNPANAATATALWNTPWLVNLSLTGAVNLGETAPRTTGNAQNIGFRSHAKSIINHAVRDKRFVNDLASDPAFTLSVGDAVLGLASSWWTGRDVVSTFMTHTVQTLHGYVTGVEVVTRGDIVFGGESGVAPVTVANRLPVAIDVILEATGVPSVRVQPRQFTSLHLNAGKRVSVEIPTRVTGSGQATLSLQVLTTNREPVGEPVTLTVRSAAYARVASYLVAAAFALLLLMVLVNTVRRVRVHRRGGGGE